MERQVDQPTLNSIRRCSRCQKEYEVEKRKENEASGNSPRLPKVNARGESICSNCPIEGGSFTTPVRHEVLNSIVSHVRARREAAQRSTEPTGKCVHCLIVIAVMGVLMLATVLLHLEQSARRSSTLFDMLTLIQAGKYMICN